MNKPSFLLVFSLSACSDATHDERAAEAPSVSPQTDGEDSAAPVASDSSDAATAPTFKTLEDLPACAREQPSLACIRQLFLPLRSGKWPFDAARVERALGTNAFAVAPG